jgi:6,7-dimethyl-8-ribityllumazine synthase
VSGHLEDTGDWPFRESGSFRLPPEPPPEPEEAVAPVVAEAAVEDVRLEPLNEGSPIEESPEPESDEPEAPEAPSPAEEPVAAQLEALGRPELDEPELDEPALDEPELEEPELEEPELEEAGEAAAEHAEGELDVPAGYTLLEGSPTGERRTVGIVVGRFNGDITNLLLQSALEELEDAGVSPQATTIMPVPGAFELPLAAMALAKTRRYACVVALGCVIRGETPHFDFVASAAASGLQLAAIETGVPVSFGVLTCETREQAEARVAKGAEAVRAGLEMADLFSHLRAQAAAGR